MKNKTRNYSKNPMTEKECLKTIGESKPHHTPTPWKPGDVWRSDGPAGETWHVKIESGKELIVPANALGATREKAIANAALICKAVNAYEKDQETIRELLDIAQGMKLLLAELIEAHPDKIVHQKALVIVNRTLAKAEGK